MTEYYKFVYDENQAKKLFEFISDGLPRYVIYAFISRRKYDPNLTCGECFSNFYRKIRDGDQFVEEIRRREVAKGLIYTFDKKTGEKYHLKQDSMGVYVVPNISDSIKSIADIVKMHNLMASNICRACAEKRDTLNKCVAELRTYSDNLDIKFIGRQTSNVIYRFIHFDIDSKETYVVDMIRDFLKENKIEKKDYFFVETRNGYHLLIDTENNKKIIENAHKSTMIKDKSIAVEICPKGSPMPVPGCYVGGFEVRIIEL